MLANYVKENRLQHLKIMHKMILETKNKDICADWLLLLHDEPSETNFTHIAESDGFYGECYDLFLSLIDEKDSY